MDLMELTCMLKLCREYNVTEFETSDYKIKMAAMQTAIPVFDSPLKEEIGTELKPTEDQLLFWSSGNLIDPEAQQPEI